jgi:tyrosinase
VASVRKVALAGVTDTVLGPPKGTAAGDLVVAAFAVESRWVLRFTGIRSKGPAQTSYEVYLGLASNAAANTSDARHYVGLLSLFGVYEASRDDGTSSGAGRMRVLDVTPQVKTLGANFDVGTAAVRLVPLNPDRDLDVSRVSVDQITIEFA